MVNEVSGKSPSWMSAVGSSGEGEGGGAAPDLGKLKATLEVIDQFGKLTAQAAEAGAELEKRQTAAASTLGNIGQKASEVASSLPAAAGRLHRDLSQKDAASRIERMVLTTIKGLMTFSYFWNTWTYMQAITLAVGLPVALIGLKEWVQKGEAEKLHEGGKLMFSPTQLLVNCAKGTLDTQTVIGTDLMATFSNLEESMGAMLDTDQEAGKLQRATIVICKGVMLLSSAAVAVPATVLATLCGLAALPSGGLKKGAFIAALPVMTTAVMVKSILVDAYVLGSKVFSSESPQSSTG